jgi:hypothetical protein
LESQQEQQTEQKKRKIDRSTSKSTTTDTTSTADNEAFDQVCCKAAFEAERRAAEKTATTAGSDEPQPQSNEPISAKPSEEYHAICNLHLYLYLYLYLQFTIRNAQF